MDQNTDSLLNKIHEIYCAKGLREEYTNMLGFKSSKSIQNLEEIGRDELFKVDLLSSCSEFSHNGIITRPGKKSTVLVIGNHSAGKSSFINWYIGEKIQNTGIAVETSHFTIITYGEKTNELRSEGTLGMYPFLREIMNRNLKEVYGTFFANLNTKISSKKNNLFQFVDFIDTPGLTDGYVRYNCDIIEMMKWMSNYVDLVLVLLDPIGQALCTKTMDMIEFLSRKYPQKVKVCLSKADQIDNEEDFHKLSIQIHSAISTMTEQINVEIIPFSILENSKTISNKIHSITEAIEKSSKSKALTNIEILNNDCYFILNHSAYLKSKHESECGKSKRTTIIKVFLILVLTILCYNLFEILYFEINNTSEDIIIRVVLSLACIVALLITSSKKIVTLSSNELARLDNWNSYCKDVLSKTQDMTNEYFTS